MNDGLEPIHEYNGDIILIEKLAEFYPSENWEWNEGEIITLEDISIAIHNGMSEIPDPYGDTYMYQPIECKSNDWHIGRIIYFINHPEEIRDVEIDNMCNGMEILPIPVIVDGHHRFAAARWLYDQGKLKEIHCMYGGRVDVLEYLQGKRKKLEE